MNYGLDAPQKWCFLVGLYQTEQKTIGCQMQLFFIEKRQQQLLEGYAGAFADIQLTDVAQPNSVFVFCEKKAAEASQKLHIMEIGDPPAGQPKSKKSCEIQYPPDCAGDFPVIMQVAENYGVAFIVTKFGYLYVFELS